MAKPFDHLVVLMLENRSFDHMLGFLKADDYKIDGLNGDETNPSATNGAPVRVSRDARTVHDLNPDPGHEFLNVNTQIFGNPEGQVTGPMMQGFVKDYALVSNHAAQGPNVMKCFNAATLPVLSTLAQQYAICDHWYSSVPGSTIPNRLFAHAAHSAGSLTQDVIAAPSKIKTIFEVMNDPLNPSTFRIYTAGVSLLLANIYLMHHQEHFHPYSEFRNDCAKGDIPEYTFIEPTYDDDIANGIVANSQHPDFPVDEGEALISDVYSAISRSPLWESTLLLIVHDEHGGIFDHRTPPTLTPDPKFAAVPPSHDPPFAFDRLGVRVPAVFVSPRIQPRTIITTQFDHCSIVATVRKLFCLDQTPFNWREAQATTFDNILNLPADQARRPVVLPDPVASSPAPDPASVPAAAAGTAPGAARDFVFAGAPPKVPPPVRRPTDLILDMARAIQYSAQTIGLEPPMRVSQIYSSQDAARFFDQTTTLLKDKGSHR